MTRGSIVLVDTNAIAAAHAVGCWNAIRRHFKLHSVQICVEEATRPNKRGHRLVNRTAAELGGELVIGKVYDADRADLRLAIGNRIDVDEGEADLIAFARTLRGKAWWLCGPDAGSVSAMHLLGLIDRLVALETLAKACGQALVDLPANYTERWLSDQRTRRLFDAI